VPVPVPSLGILRSGLSVVGWQALKVIDEAIDYEDTPVGIRGGLLERLRENPARPEQALLAHLQDLANQTDQGS
jgi:hypothetical protein